MTSILLRGGLLRLNTNPTTFKSVNILLSSSPAWLEGIVCVKNTPYFRLSSTKDNFIEIKDINDHYLLTVNKRIIYRAEDIFGYTIDLKLNNMIQDKNIPYTDFFKYY